jgi:GT2 family glycosyltransferase
MTRDQVTIIVLNWNRKEETLACLDSLAKADLGGATVLVVDNGSNDGSIEAIRQHFPNIEVVALPENRGYAGGNNAGIRLALERGAQGVLLLNNDTEVAPDFLQLLLWALDAFPCVAGVCSAIHRRDRPEMLDVAYAEVRFDQHHAVQLRGVNALPGQGYGERVEIGVAVGCSLLLTAEALRAVGLFDERYFAYHEDVDWCLRAHRLGFRFVYEPHSRVFHRGSGTTGKLAAAQQVERLEVEAGLLPNAEPLPWNPIRTYLGSRNLLRLLREFATAQERRRFVQSCAYEIPLEILAITFGREGWLRLGRFGYPDALRVHFLERHRARLDGLGAPAKAGLLALTVPFDLLWTLPRELWRAWRGGRFDEMICHLRGLWDGWRDRPLPLQRLGLR